MITLTNGVQVPENAVQLRTTAPMDGYYVAQPLQLVQYDETLPVAAVQLTYQNQPYIPPTGAELNVRMSKPDGKGVYNPCLGVDSSGIAYFVFTQQMTVISGTGTLTVEVTDSGVKNSAPIIVNVAPNPVQEGSIESADEFLTLQEILAEAEKWGQIVQANAANIQEVVDNLPAIEAAPEAAQQAAASAAAAQKAAQEALGFRTFFSAVRPDSNGNLDPSRPMTVGPAASVEIESVGDRIQSVTAIGFTTQAGSGDPSPSNVRQLTNGGLKLVEIAFDGTENWTVFESAESGNAYYLPDVPAPAKINDSAPMSLFTFGLSVSFENRTSNPDKWRAFVSGDGQFAVRAPVKNNLSLEQFKALLSGMYANGNPAKGYYFPADESDATGLYAPIILTSGEYRATCLDLTAPLCEGDSVVSYIKSGCDRQLTLDGSTLAVAASGSNYTVAAANAVAGGTVYASGLAGLSLTAGSITIPGTAFPASVTNAGQANTWLQSNPQTLYYQSTAYTEADDIAVSLETHQAILHTLAGDGDYQHVDGWASGAIVLYSFFADSPSVPGFDQTADIKCSHLVTDRAERVAANTQGCAQGGGRNLYLNFGDTYNTKELAVQYIKDQYAADTPVQIKATRSTPITYAHPAVILEAATGDQLTYTVTGQSGGTVSVALKPFQDGGHAKTADNAANAQNATQFDGLTLSALKNLLVPVGYIFSWAPVDDGPDLSTAQKVAAYFGFGTWQAYGTGQVLVGVDSGQTEFATVGQTGGEKTHTLTVQEIPSHNHPSNSRLNWVNEPQTGQGPLSTVSSNLVVDASSYDTGNTGGGQAHNNLQPYITVYRWQRVA